MTHFPLALHALLGLLIGSFLNVVICRLPLHEDVVFTPSHCPRCGRRLRWFELVPVVSWLALRGRCRGCGVSISVLYPLTEIGNAALWALAADVMGFRPEMFLVCGFLSVLLCAAAIDARTGLIPLALNVAIAVLGLCRLAFARDLAWAEQLIGLFALSAPLLLLDVLWRRLRGEDAIGGGDVKLLAAAGLFLGYKNLLFGFASACVLASFIHLARMAAAKAGRKLALGPYLAAGLALAALFGDVAMRRWLEMWMELWQNF
jgi:leader peptidase (prepilin peptidase)/N-methyltransferase